MNEIKVKFIFAFIKNRIIFIAIPKCQLKFPTIILQGLNTNLLFKFNLLNTKVNNFNKKVIKNHLKIVSRSNDKLIIGKIEPKNYSSISKTINPTPIKNTQNTTRKGLKI